ncbi:hypothetical protein HHI36_009961, partial [Cryptolaemus montrouzieri]
VQCETDTALVSQLKVRADDLKNIYKDFQFIYNQVIGALAEGDDFASEDFIRKRVDNFYYSAKALYNDLISVDTSTQSSLGQNQKDNVELPQLNVSIFDGNFSNWQTF